MIHVTPNQEYEQRQPARAAGRSNVFEDWMRQLTSPERCRLMEHLRTCVARQVRAMSEFGRPDPMRILAQSIVNAYVRESDIEYAELRMLLDDPIAHAQVAILNLALDHISDVAEGINSPPVNPMRRRRRARLSWMDVSGPSAHPPALPPFFH